MRFFENSAEALKQLAESEGAGRFIVE